MSDVKEKHCSKCGEIINPARVEALPHTTVCVNCQAQSENSPEIPTKITDKTCPRCAKRGVKSYLVFRTARDPSKSGHFLGCSSYPSCRYVER